MAKAGQPSTDADRWLTPLRRLVQQSPAEATSLALVTNTGRTVRFAYERVHQDLFQQTAMLYVKVHHHGRTGVASVRSADPTQWAAALADAYRIAHVTPKQSRRAPLPQPQTLPTVDAYDPNTAALEPTDYLPPLQQLMQYSVGCGVHLAGSFVTGSHSLTVVNSAGVACTQPSTTAMLKLVAIGPMCSGYASQVVRHIAALDWEQVLERALRKCLTQTAPRTIPTGAYRVLLEPEAVAELLSWLSYTSFGAKQFTERTSCLSGRLGEQMTGSVITITDDGLDATNLAMPFDFEGVPKQRTPLIEHGVARGLVYDTYYAQLHDTQSTGHASTPDTTEGPMPWHLAMAPGDATYEAMVRALDHGLIVTRFHYVSGFLDTRHALMTGLTRDGTFLVKHGAVVGPVHNVRFTERIFEAFARTQLISRDRQLITDPARDLGGIVCPALLLDQFAITGTIHLD